jgi:hypothetical protein
VFASPRKRGFFIKQPKSCITILLFSI